MQDGANADSTPVLAEVDSECAISVDAKDLAVMAGTLANGGKNPVTKQQVLDPELVPRVLAVMATAGL